MHPPPLKGPNPQHPRLLPRQPWGSHKLLSQLPLQTRFLSGPLKDICFERTGMARNPLCRVVAVS